MSTDTGDDVDGDVVDGLSTTSSSPREEENRSGRALWRKCIEIVKRDVLSGAKKRFLEDFFLFRDLQEETKARLRGKIHEVTLRAQQYLYKRNHYPMDVYLLVEGALDVSANL
jgi:hypothetical protein